MGWRLDFKTLNVVLGLVFNCDNQVLIAQRNKGTCLTHLWEFPGGKINAEELTFNALKRELMEEIGIVVVSAIPILKFRHSYDQLLIKFKVWRIQEFLGVPMGQEGQNIQWVNIGKLRDIKFPDANQVIIDAIENRD